DLEVKVRKIEEFLAEGDKVKVSVKFRGREMAHPELGRQVLDRVATELKGTAMLERTPIMEGKMISMIVTRAPGWEPPKKAAPVARERKNSSGLQPASNGEATGEADDVAVAQTVAAQQAHQDAEEAPTA
ncbi:MAG: translation initiation factor IF-3, partial [Ktedonobacterales bacterium]